LEISQILDMKHFLLTWLGTAIALLITAKIVPGFIVKSFVAALIAAIVIGLVNAFIRPILGILAFPVTLLTFGLFTFVLNALALWLASALTPSYGFIITGFIPALLGSIVLSIVSSLISYFLRIVE
jgi:putative membrane protein